MSRVAGWFLTTAYLGRVNFDVNPSFSGSTVAPRAAGSKSVPAKRISKPFERLERDLTIEVASLYHGFAAFARKQLALEPSTLLAAFVDTGTDSWTAFEQEQPDPERVAMHASTLTALWQWRLDPKTHPEAPDFSEHNRQPTHPCELTECFVETAARDVQAASRSACRTG
jgi:hypothetical protein